MAASKYVNVVMLGALAAALGEPALEDLEEATVQLLGKKVPAETLHAALESGYSCLS
jgi:Pyruvate/2-oxoacid:ferredoxin oxidoreductase gamma subunit